MIKFKFFLVFIIFFVFYTNIQNANEVLIYADSINYDANENIVARGNAKIIYKQKILTSDLIIYNKNDDKYNLPSNFNFKDEKNNYYSGTSAIFSKNLNSAEIQNIKLLLNDGSRIVGKSAVRNGYIDIITKGAYSPCDSKIKIGRFICPIWQLEAEKILHDNDKLFLYQKHAKMKIFNSPVFYIPYIVTPSPLRKKRKSGFLTPSISFNFLDTKVSQSTSLPYYFNLDLERELTFTPVFNYGGGVNSSQRFLLDYNQLTSGGKLNIELSVDTTLENKNNENWFQDGSLITDYSNNINEKFYLNINSSIQTSKAYFRSADPNNLNSYKTDLSTTLNLYGYNLKKMDDKLRFNISSYQIIQNNVDNGTTPLVLPFIEYHGGMNTYKKIDFSNNYSFYKISRDVNTEEHSKKQIKTEHLIKVKKELYNYNSKINLYGNLYNQFYNTEQKKIDGINKDSNYYKFFPMTGLKIETPFIEKNTNLLISPSAFFILSSGQSNSNKISNEESTNNTSTITNNNNLNRYSGTDKLDNSKRINFAIYIEKNNSSLNLSQNYEFTKNSNYHKESGNYDYLSNLLINYKYENKSNIINYDITYDPNEDFVKSQYISAKNENNLFNLNITYLDEKNITNNIINNSNENLNWILESKKIKKYSKLKFSGNYDLLNDETRNYKIGYSYFDECFGINLDFDRKLYTDVDLKSEDKLTIMFSFKNLGSYKSTNLAVSETDKQDIEWDSSKLKDEFYK